MEDHCPHCGAVLVSENSCEDLFNTFLALEFSNSEYGKVHLLTVACYMIQHQQYSDEGLIWIYRQLTRYLNESVPTEYIRREAGWETNNRQRTWQVGRKPGAAALPEIRWEITIQAIPPYAGDPEQYCQAVTNWARATVNQMAAYPFLQGNSKALS